LSSQAGICSISKKLIWKAFDSFEKKGCRKDLSP